MTARKILLEHVGLGRPFRFERTIAAAITVALLAIVTIVGFYLRSTGRLALGTPRAWYFIYLSGLLILGIGMTRHPTLSSIALSLAALEIGLGMGSATLVRTGLASGSIFPVNYTVEPTFTWHPLLQAVPMPTPPDRAERSVFFHNSRHLRGKERTPESLSGKTVVALFGGSTTYDQSVPDGQTWADRLEYLLGSDRFAVINHGMGGYSTAEHVIETAFYESAFGVPPRCAIYYIGWNDLQNAHLSNLDAAYADFHLPSQVDAEEARRIGGRHLAWSPALTYLARLTVLAFDTARPSLWPMGEQRADPDPVLESIYQRNIDTISAINRQRGIRTVWIGQLLNRTALLKETPYRWIPLVRDRDVWPLVLRLNRLLRDRAEALDDLYVDVDIDDFRSDDFADQGHFTPAGSLNFAAHLAPVIADACRGAKRDR